MENRQLAFTIDYLVKRTGKHSDAKIFAGGREVGEIRKGSDSTYVLSTEGKDRLTFSRRVHGEIRPFSLLATALESGLTVLTIRDNLFRHHEKLYMLANSPEGRPLRELLLGKRYISRLDNFPFKPEETDHETRGRLRRFRGVAVGEMDGLGTEGHRVKLSEELEDIGLPLAAACYLLHSTA